MRASLSQKWMVPSEPTMWMQISFKYHKDGRIDDMDRKLRKFHARDGKRYRLLKTLKPDLWSWERYHDGGI